MKFPIIAIPNRQEFPDAPEWISKLLYPLQIFMSSVLNGLNNQLTLQDNLSCVINSTTFTAGVSDTNNIYTFQCNLGRQPVELSAHVTRTDGSYEVVYPQVSWNFVNNQIVVNGIKGLTNGKQYSIVYVVK